MTPPKKEQGIPLQRKSKSRRFLPVPTGTPLRVNLSLPKHIRAQPLVGLSAE